MPNEQAAFAAISAQVDGAKYLADSWVEHVGAQDDEAVRHCCVVVRTAPGKVEEQSWDVWQHVGQPIQAERIR